MDQETQRQVLYALLGDLPPPERPVAATLLARETRDDYELETLLLDLNGLEPVPAYFVKPRQVQGSIPCILYNHAHGGKYDIGKEELLVGRSALQSPPYAQALTTQGWGALCIDAWAFGERATRSESAIFKEMLWQGRVMWGMMVYDSLQALDYLCTRPDVDAERLGTLGMSMGSTMAWWLAALDTRIKVCVDICCLTDFQALIDSDGLDLHSIYYYVPSLLKYFSTAQINALISPRPHLALAGDQDPLTPPVGLDRIDIALRQVYANAGCPEAWRLSCHHAKHEETAAMRQEAISFLRAWL